MHLLVVFPLQIFFKEVIYGLKYYIIYFPNILFTQQVWLVSKTVIIS